MIVLGIESSCDDLGAAVIDGDRVLSNVVHTQTSLFEEFGGIVPEIASRDHARMVSRVIGRALMDAGVDATKLDGIAVTSGPGLIGSLLCGVEAAKGMAVATGAPLIGVNHLEGHIASAFLEDQPPSGPFVALIVSGGHSSLVHVEALGGPYRVLGATRDDAAGEAFDKTAKLLGLGYPGGVEIDRLAKAGDRARFSFPQPMPGRDNLDFSFSGLKTAALRLLETLDETPHGQDLADFCASFQNAIVENLTKKAFRAVTLSKTNRLVLVGGVAANSRLRERATERAKRQHVALHLPSKANCTDNAAMIARAGIVRLSRGERDGVEFSARAHWPLTEIAGGR